VGVLGCRHDFLQDTVQAQAHTHLGLVRLDVNITGVDPDGVLNDRVDQLDDRRVGHLVRDLLGDAHHFLDIEFLLQLLDGLLGLFFAVVGIDGVHDLLAGADPRADLFTGHIADLVDGNKVQRVVHDQHDLVVLDRDRDQHVLLGHFLVDQARRSRVDLDVAQFNIRNPALVLQGLHDLDIGQYPLFDQDIAQFFAFAVLLLRQSLFKLLRCQQT